MFIKTFYILLSCKKYFGECSLLGLTDTLASRKHDGTLNHDENKLIYTKGHYVGENIK